MTGCCARLAHLVEMAQERDHGTGFAGLIHQRLAAAQRGPGQIQKIADQLFGFRHMGLAVRLFASPAGPCHKQQFRVRADGLRIGIRRFKANHLRAAGGRRNLDLFQRGRAGASVPGLKNAPIQRQKPGPLSPIQRCLHTLPVVPALNLERAFGRRQRAYMGFDTAIQTHRDAGQRPGKTARRRSQHQSRTGLARQCLHRRRIRGIPRRLELRPFHGQKGLCAAGGDTVGGSLHRFSHQADSQRRSKRAGQPHRRAQRFQIRGGQGAIILNMRQNQKSFHHVRLPY